MTRTIVVDQETAQREFDAFCEDWGLDNDLDAMNEEDRESFKTQAKPILQAYMYGALISEESDEGDVMLTYTLTKPVKGLDVLKFKLPEGVAYLKMIQSDKDTNFKALFNFLGHISGTAPRALAKIKGRDLKFATGLATLFLGS
jgi:hypothetical protein